MKIALIQMNLAWCDAAANLHRAEEMMKSTPGADVYVLPEMFTTGFCMEPERIAEPAEGSALQWMRRVAGEMDAAVAGSVATIAPDGGYRNRMYFVTPDGQVTHYDKRHLFSYSGEDKHYEAGAERVIVAFRGVRFLLQVCYDLRFPVWARNRSGHDYDIILAVANWPDIRIQYWDALIAARATENQCYIAAVNCVGDDGMGLHYNGHSVAYDTRLQPIASFADDEEGTKIADFDIEKLHHFREVLPLWKDIDRFELQQ